jgi:protein involved in plasmid replication-relaxation
VLITADAKGIEPSELRYTHERGLRIATSTNLAHHVEANEFFTRLAVEANASGGALSEWYGVRTLAHMLSGAVVPDGYGVLAMAGTEPLHVLLELDRATEATRVLVEKARRYAEILPRSSLRNHRPLVLSQSRARSAPRAFGLLWRACSRRQSSGSGARVRLARLLELCALLRAVETSWSDHHRRPAQHEPGHLAWRREELHQPP